MNLIKTFVATLCMASVTAFAAPTPTVAPPDAPLPETTLKRKGQAQPLDPAVPLYVTVLKNPKAEAIFHDIFRQRGYTLVSEPGPGVMVLTFGGALELSLPGARKRLLGLDEFVEDPASLADIADPSKSSAKGAMAAGSSAAINIGLLAAGVTNLASAIGGFGVGLGEATGAAGKFNRMLTGDSRGICIWPCHDWNMYSQTVVFVTEETTPDGVSTKSAITVGIKDETLYPSQLFQVALATLSSDLMGDPMPEVFAKIEEITK